MKTLTFSLALLSSIQAWAADCNLPKGTQAFNNKCGICHVVGSNEPHSIGPNLFGIVNRNIGSMKEFNYSEALTASNQEKWSKQKLDNFLTSPTKSIPGTVMPFQGIRSIDERNNIICYLETVK